MSNNKLSAEQRDLLQRTADGDSLQAVLDKMVIGGRDPKPSRTRRLLARLVPKKDVLMVITLAVAFTSIPMLISTHKSLAFTVLAQK